MLKEYLSSIANAIRSKLGITVKINAQSFPDKINEVYEKGSEDAYNEFWDSFMPNGSGSMSCDYRFTGGGWTDENFRPKYNIKPNYNSGVSTFCYSGVKNLEECLKHSGYDGKKEVIIDLSNGGNCNSMFSSSKIEVIPELDFSKVTGMYNTFATTTIHTIRKIISSKTTNWSTLAFSTSTSSQLKEVRIDGVIAKSTSLQYQKLLSADSIFSFIEALCPDSDVTGVSITFNQTTVNNIPFPYTSPKTGITYTSWNDEGDATSVESLRPSNWSISAV